MLNGHRRGLVRVLVVVFMLAMSVTSSHAQATKPKPKPAPAAAAQATLLDLNTVLARRTRRRSLTGVPIGRRPN
jgi:hypothetical protein